MMEKPANDGRPQRNASPALRFLTIGEIANCLDASTRTVRRWIKSRALLARRIEGIVRISEADFAATRRAHVREKHPRDGHIKQRMSR
jgi:excisionase family DNA binding protein